MQQNLSFSISDSKENNEEHSQRNEENVTPIPINQIQTNDPFKINQDNRSQVKQQNKPFHTFNYLENKFIIKQFWKQVEYYAVKSQCSGFNDFQMLIDLGLIKEVDPYDPTRTDYIYAHWLWKYAKKCLPQIKRRSWTVYKVILKVMDDSLGISESFDE